MHGALQPDAQLGEIYFLLARHNYYLEDHSTCRLNQSLHSLAILMAGNGQRLEANLACCNGKDFVFLKILAFTYMLILFFIDFSATLLVILTPKY